MNMKFIFKTPKFVFSFLLINILLCTSLLAQKIPKVHTNIKVDEKGQLYVEYLGNKAYALIPKSMKGMKNIKGVIKGDKKGLKFNFKNNELNGKMFYGFIPYNETKYPQPVYFSKSTKIVNGHAKINLLKMKGRYDMIAWEKNKIGTLGYRIVGDDGQIWYDGVITFEYGKKFKVAKTIIEGPFVNILKSNSVVISFKTNKKFKATIEVDGNEFVDKKSTKNHEIEITNLKADTKYKYTVKYGKGEQSYTFKTAPKAGVRKPFVFAYASDSRAGNGGGERNVYGANFYIMKKIMALSIEKKAAFVQITGDLIDGYSLAKEDIMLQYANWKRSIEPFAHHLPVIATMGNHESLLHVFIDKNDKKYYVDKFPFETESSEAIFANEFVNPKNGPISEDGTIYDIDKSKINFPSYKENVFYYTYDNIAMIVLNSNYWHAPRRNGIPITGGNMHAYIMDNQLKWLDETIKKFEKDNNIDHVFVTIHTPAFPNGGHIEDDMWCSGNNKFRPYISGKPCEKGIIERRDEFLDIIINKNKKVVALLTGDEHNYCRLTLSAETKIYNKDYKGKKLKLTRKMYQLNNGAAGAPYYAQEQVPWSEHVNKFSTQNALILISVEGKKVSMKVINPDTFELLDEAVLRN